MRSIDADVLINKLTTSIYYGQLHDCGADGIAELEAVLADVRNMPTVEPAPRWVPASERLPEESGLYIVTNVGRWVEPVGTRYYNIRVDGGFWSGHPGDKVLAWMPLPAPYKEDTE